jgi:hypothetical protein
LKGIGRRTGGVGRIPVEAPFGNVAADVEAPGVRGLRCDRAGAVAGVALVPGDVPAVPRGGGAGAAGILPLGFGRQGDRAAGLFGKPRAEGLGIGEGDEADRVIGRLREAGIAPGELLALDEDRAVPAVAAAGAGLGLAAVAGFGDEALPLAAGDRAAAEVVVAGQRDRP